MRIAITHPYSWPDVRRGAERIIVESSRALAARGHDVTILTSGGAASRRRAGGVRTIRYRRLFPNGYRHEHWFGWRVLPALVAGRFDVVHSYMPWDALSSIRAARVTGHRTVYQELGNPIRSVVERRGDRPARERVIDDIDVFGCMSEFSRDHLERDYGRRGAIIPGGVRMTEFEPRPRHEQPTILFSGAIDRPEKRVRELLDGIALLVEHRSDVRVLLSGPGDATSVLEAAPPIARERTTALGVGETGDLAGLYASAWVTCLPTLTDSFGLVVVESLASGTPVLAGPEGAPREVVDDRVGAVAETLEPEDIAQALDRALALAHAPGTVDACREVAARFDWDDAIAPLLEGLYRSTERL